jgi:sarcosine oxidase
MAQLAGRGLRVLGIDRHDVPNDLGASSGLSRIIRTAYFEDPRYVPLVRRAWTLWEELARQVREPLLHRTGCLLFGLPGSLGVEGAERSARAHGLAIERLDAADIARRFPAIRPGDGDVGVYEDDAGVLVPERCVAAHALVAVRDGGAELRARERVTAIEPLGDGVRVTTDAGRHDAGACVVTAGPWLGTLCPVPIAVVRQVQCWFQPAEPAPFEIGRLPVYARFAPDGDFYGMPRHDHVGVKVCRHHGGAATTADELDRAIAPADEADVRRFVRAHLPGADGPLVSARVCMYANTPDGNFAVGALPGAARVFVAGGGSGHAFKFAPVIGEAIADLVADGTTRHPIGFLDPARFQV